jgi:hypothetical protein
LVVVVQEARRFFGSPNRPPTVTPTAKTTLTPAPTPPNSRPAAPAPTQPAAAGQPLSGPTQSAGKPPNLTGKWAGAFSETVDGAAAHYRYMLEFSQQGNIVAGKSTLEKEDDPSVFARFVVRGQITKNADTYTIKISEDLVAAQKLRSGSAAAPRTTQLNYVLTQSQEHLEGVWIDRRYAEQNISGTVKLLRQP